MKLALILMAVVAFTELMLWVRPVWSIRRQYAAVLIVFQSIASGLLLGSDPSLWTILILVLSTYRVINLLRVVQDRTKQDYLYHVSRKTSLILLLWQASIVVVVLVSRSLQASTYDWWLLLGALQLAFGVIMLSSTLKNIKATQMVLTSESLADRDLPTLSVCIPARNETIDLENCLRSLTLSTYPKLEILVLDDCSQDKRTPEIIRGFAQKGIRFIAGQIPPDNWLAKNFAYKQLSDQANGQLRLFCGVDAIFAPESLRLIVESMLAKKKSMLSLIPVNLLPGSKSVSGFLVQAERYAWELSLPRNLFNRPAVLSTCWLITEEALRSSGGFEAVSRSASPERYFARHCASQSSGYSFMQSGESLGVGSAKSLDEQKSTAIRTRYPQLHRRPELVCLVSLLQLALTILPIGTLIYFAFVGHWLLVLSMVVDIIMLLGSFYLVIGLTYNRRLFFGLFLQPLASIYDVWLLNRSMWQYEFQEVIWKGRNVCLPVMHVSPSLPKIKATTVN